MKLECTISDNGSFHAYCGEKYAMVAEFLESDIQGSPEIGYRFLDGINLVISGNLHEWMISGNAHTLFVTPNEIRIENDFDDSLPACRVDVNPFKSVLQQWIDFLENHSGKTK